MFRRRNFNRGHGYGYQPARGRGQDMYFILLVAQLFQQIANLEHKPPITLGLMAFQALVFMRAELPHEMSCFVPSISDGCLNPHRIWKMGQWSRLIWSAFLHADEHHLYFNMASFLWKGVHLEGSLGPMSFAALIVELLLVSNGLAVATAYGLAASFPEYRRLPLDLNIIGFSAVLFGLKVVLNYSSTSGWSNIMGIPVPVKYLCWAELVVASLINPKASFLGHLTGIAAGFIHIKVTRRIVHEIAMLLDAARGVSGPRRNLFRRSAVFFRSSGQSGRQTVRPEVRQRQAENRSRSEHLANPGATVSTTQGDGPLNHGPSMDIPPRPRAPVSGLVEGPPSHPTDQVQPSASELRELRLRRFAGQSR